MARMPCPSLSKNTEPKGVFLCLGNDEYEPDSAFRVSVFFHGALAASGATLVILNFDYFAFEYSLLQIGHLPWFTT
jgi:hypothetical protein